MTSQFYISFLQRWHRRWDKILCSTSDTGKIIRASKHLISINQQLKGFQGEYPQIIARLTIGNYRK